MNVTLLTENHPTATPFELQELCGALLPWVYDAEEEVDLIEVLSNSYGFGRLMELRGGELSETGAYNFPGDPELLPICSIDRKHEMVYIYHYGIVGIMYKDDRKPFITRLD